MKVVSSDYGRILADGHGRALYLFTADQGKASNCAGDCATAWPPYTVKSKPPASGRRTGQAGPDVETTEAAASGQPVY